MDEIQENAFNNAYNRMKRKFTELAGYEPADDSEIGIKIKVLASEIADIEVAVKELKDQETT